MMTGRFTRSGYAKKPYYLGKINVKSRIDKEYDCYLSQSRLWHLKKRFTVD